MWSLEADVRGTFTPLVTRCASCEVGGVNGTGLPPITYLSSVEVEGGSRVVKEGSDPRG